MAFHFSGTGPGRPPCPQINGTPIRTDKPTDRQILQRLYGKDWLHSANARQSKSRSSDTALYTVIERGIETSSHYLQQHPRVKGCISVCTLFRGCRRSRPNIIHGHRTLHRKHCNETINTKKKTQKRKQLN